jgi:hypothetical protein
MHTRRHARFKNSSKHTPPRTPMDTQMGWYRPDVDAYQVWVVRLESCCCLVAVEGQQWLPKIELGPGQCDVCLWPIRAATDSLAGGRGYKQQGIGGRGWGLGGGHEGGGRGGRRAG